LEELFFKENITKSESSSTHSLPHLDLICSIDTRSNIEK